jgi:hypothetical protein
MLMVVTVVWPASSDVVIRSVSNGMVAGAIAIQTTFLIGDTVVTSESAPTGAAMTAR